MDACVVPDRRTHASSTRRAFERLRIGACVEECKCEPRVVWRD
jgi:hypothetical protein